MGHFFPFGAENSQTRATAHGDAVGGKAYTKPKNLTEATNQRDGLGPRGVFVDPREDLPEQSGKLTLHYPL